MSVEDRENKIVDDLIAAWAEALSGQPDALSNEAISENLADAEKALLDLVPETFRAAQAKLLLMNSMIFHGEAADRLDGERPSFREERDRLAEMLVAGGCSLSLLLNYLPDI